jgi:exopolyphosphatase/guanosine-5'-triphosphate,3'-diphosphate pyrophosphatase
MQSTKSPVAVIDLGTNTFHLLIAEPDGHSFRALHQETRVMKIGQGGISQGLLTESAYQRTLDALAHFRTQADSFGIDPEQIFATATSAIRNARNGSNLIDDIETRTGIRVQVISGEQEAEYIYYGVRAALPLGTEPSLVMDIGGGSVEFIVGNESQIYWKQSFEIGAQRLLDLFVQTDPIPAESVRVLNLYLEEKLAPLTEAVRQYQPRTLVGSSGSFDTLAEIHYLRTGQEYDEKKASEFILSTAAFENIYQQLITLSRSERLQIPGMLEMRVDMIVMAACLIDFVLRQYGLLSHPIRVSSYALKEGVLYRLMEQRQPPSEN